MDSAATSVTDKKKPPASLQVVQRSVFRYTFALISVALALSVGLLARHFGIREFEFAVFLFAIIVTAWNSGAGPAMVAVICSSLAYDYFFVVPIYSLAV
ncbi:MAG TPA: DUF4118 domain-containing protein, partial [Verrucomicrobiae bacterium]|nr:DUF4118 domain-containing protein [Verrucomicrobiae bacterium]